MSSPDGTFHCNKCDYQCGSRRVLASHDSAVHSGKVFKCPHCPFVSRYQANFYRHRRIVHKIGRTTCHLCNLDCLTPEALVQHKELDHGQGLEDVLDRYQRDKDQAAKQILVPEPEVTGEGYEYCDEEEERARLKKAEALYFSGYGYEALEQQNNPDYQPPDDPEEAGVFYSIKNGTNVDVVELNPTEQPSTSAVTRPVDKMQRSPLKVKRHYTCKDCGLQTVDPREFLYHRKEVHFDRISVHECPYCIYATKHFQKLQRHCGLVHKNHPKPVVKAATDPSPFKMAQASVSGLTVKTARKSMAPVRRTSQGRSRPMTSPASVPAKIANKVSPRRSSSSSVTSASTVKQAVPLIKCTRCDFQCKSRILMSQHEKTVHLRKRFFRCLQCGYVTNERGRYTKHVKYHSLPKVKCEECDFYTTYKWNMDRHMKSHEMDGPFKCPKCSFAANNRQSMTFHLAKHHNGEDQDANEEEEEGENGVMDEEENNEEEDDDEEEEDEDNQEGDEDEQVDVEGEEEEEEDYEEEAETTNENSLEDFLGSESHLACRFCSFKTYSKSALAKHEDSHGNSKRYPCPLCVVSFDHVAWLAKHLTQKHGEPTDSKDIVKAAKDAKNRSHPPNIVSGTSARSKMSSSPPSSPPVLKVNKATKSFASPQGGLGPRAKKTLPKKNEGESSQNDSTEENGEARGTKLQYSCTVCSYRTRWLSEMEKHVRVHSLERPFGCPSCLYRCKWKGDLKRHVLKYHDESLVEQVEKMKAPASDGSVAGYTVRDLDKPRPNDAPEASKPSLKMKINKAAAIIPARSILKPARLRTLLTQGKEEKSKPGSYGKSFRGEYDSEDTEVSVMDEGHESDPGDLVIDESYGNYEPNVVYNRRDNKRKRSSTEDAGGPSKKAKGANRDSPSPSATTNKKYKCTFCPFMSRTASRFHVHIVQHLNKKPFMCSTCFYRSNWEWDITKHIKIKSARDESHRHASMLVTDESGRKNYEKYNRFLVDVDDSNAEDEEASERAEDEVPESPEQEAAQEPDEEYPNYLISPEDVETIVVTPDLGGEDKEDQVESIELDLSRYFNSVRSSPEKTLPPPEKNNTKLYFCRHCPFKNAEKKAVVGHLSLHAGTKPFQCRICGMVSNWKHVILRHVKMRHAGTLEDVKNRLNYAEHDNVIELIGYPELNVPNKAKESVSRPRKAPAPPPPTTSTPKEGHQFQCEMCPYTCEKLCYMHFHIKQHKPREGADFKCPHCDYWVNFKKTLNRHLKVHEDQMMAETPAMAYYEPEISFEPAEEPVEDPTPVHVNLAPGQRKFQCEFCPYTTDKKKHFLYHKQFHRPNKAAPYKCDYCSYWAMHSHLITQHTKKCHTENVYGSMEDRIPPEMEIIPPPAAATPSTSHGSNRERLVINRNYGESGENEIVLVEQNGKRVRMIKCRYCPMMNRRRANVRSHEEMHSEVKHSKFPCPLCNYQCNSQGVLTSHIKLHTEEQRQQQREMDTNASPIDFDFLNQANYEPKSPPPSLGSPRSPSHAEMATPRRAFSYFCEHCPAMFKSRSDYTTHSSFHGSSLPFACDRCDYRARHKPHLHKHFLVHSEEYMARREKAQPTSGYQSPPVKSPSPKRTVKEAAVVEEPVATSSTEDEGAPPTNEVAQMSSVNQMLLLEERETAMFLEKGLTKLSHQCPNCPIAFQKPSVLSFHQYLHGVNGKYYCPHCDYSVNELRNLKTHQKVHPVKPAPVRTVLKIFSCAKCPAVFTKNNRYTKHIESHGKDNKFTCERCDFSVSLLIQLVKHRNVHKKQLEGQPEVIVPPVAAPDPAEDEAADVATEKAPETAKPEAKEKVTYCCNRCPYFHARRDAMINHQKRHTANAAMKCPHCDYSTLQASFLRDHVKWHFQPQKLIKPNSFMKYSQLEVWSVKDNKRLLLFKDNGEDKENDRFFSPTVDECDNEPARKVTPTPVVDISTPKNKEKSLQSPAKATGSPKSLSDNAVASKKLEVILTDVFKPNVRKRLGSSPTQSHPAKKIKTEPESDSEIDVVNIASSSQESDGDNRLIIDQEYTRAEESVPKTTNGPVGSEAEEEEFVPHDEPGTGRRQSQDDKRDKELYRCPSCPYVTERRHFMTSHATRHFPRSEAKFKCNRCDYWVNFRRTLEHHMKLHDAKQAAGPVHESSEEFTEEEVEGVVPEAVIQGDDVDQEQEVIDAVENMLQVAMEPPLQETIENGQVVEDTVVENEVETEARMEDEEAAALLDRNMNGIDRDVRPETAIFPSTNAVPGNGHGASVEDEADGGGIENGVALTEAGHEIDHTYAGIPQPKVTKDVNGEVEPLSEAQETSPIQETSLDKKKTDSTAAGLVEERSCNEKVTKNEEDCPSSTVKGILPPQPVTQENAATPKEGETPKESQPAKVILPTKETLVEEAVPKEMSPIVPVAKNVPRDETISTQSKVNDTIVRETVSEPEVEMYEDLLPTESAEDASPKKSTSGDDEIYQDMLQQETGDSPNEDIYDDLLPPADSTNPTTDNDEEELYEDLLPPTDTNSIVPESETREDIFQMSKNSLSRENQDVEDEDDSVSHIDMDDLIVHDEIEEGSFTNSVQEEPEEKESTGNEDRSRDEDEESRIDMSELIVHDEDVVGVDEPMDVNAADREASNILMKLNAGYFANDSSNLTNDEDNDQMDTEVNNWPRAESPKTDVLASLLLDAGVYNENQAGNH